MKEWMAKCFSMLLVVCILATAMNCAIMEGLTVEDEVLAVQVEDEQDTISFMIGELPDNSEAMEEETIDDDTDGYDFPEFDEEPVSKAATRSYSVVCYEYARYRVAAPFTFKDAPYEDAKSVGLIHLAGTIDVVRFVENEYHNLWAETANNEFIYAGYKKENGVWVKQGTEYITFWENLTEWTGEEINLYGKALEKGKTRKLHGSIQSKGRPSQIGRMEICLEKKNDFQTAYDDYYEINTWFKGLPLVKYKDIKPTNSDNTIINLNGLLDDICKFEVLDTGTYRLKCKIFYSYNGVGHYTKAVDLLQWRYKTIYIPFSVKETISEENNNYNSGNYASKITFDNIAYPANYKISTSGFTLSEGTINSTYPLKTLKSEIVSASGKVISTYTHSISGTSYAVKNLDTFSDTDNGVHFSWITEPGTYYWKLTATDEKGNSNTETMTFTAYKEGESEKVYPTKITISPTSLSLKVGETATLTSTISPSNATETGTSIKSSDTSVATVSSNGVVTAVKAGTATITISTTNGKTATCAVTVKSSDPSPSPSVDPTGVSLSSTSLTLSEGDSATLTATVMPSNASNKTIRWESSDSSVASVSSSGVITAGKQGSATITASTSNGKKATCSVKVTGPAKTTGNVKVKSVKLNYKGTVELGSSGTLGLQATLSPSDATTTLTWSSSNTKVATVSSSGLVTPVSEGTATITVKTANGKKAKVKVKVIDPYAAKSISFTEKSLTMKVGATHVLKYTVKPSTAKTTIQLTSSNPGVVFIDSNGIIAAVKKGSATITATTSNGKKAKLKIKVKN